jgi:uncharacterized membrane-anchored protein
MNISRPNSLINLAIMLLCVTYASFNSHAPVLSVRVYFLLPYIAGGRVLELRKYMYRSLCVCRIKMCEHCFQCMRSGIVAVMSQAVWCGDR